MSTNRFSNLSTSTFKPLELDEIMMVPLAKQNQHDAAQAMIDEYTALQSNRLSQDADDVDAKLKEFRNRADILSKELLDNGVNKGYLNKLRQLKRDKELEFSEQGLVGAAAANYKSAMDYVKNLSEKKEAQAGWSPAQARQWAQSQLANFKGTMNSGGDFNRFTGQGLATKVDRNQWIIDNIKNVAADKIPQGLRNYFGDDGKLSLPKFQYALRSGKIEQKDLNKIMNSLSIAAANDPDLKASLMQEAAFTGEDPNDVMDFGEMIIKKDKYGEDQYVWQPGKSSFGRQMYGLSYGAQYKDVQSDYKFVEDKVGFNLYKSGLDAKKADQLVRAANSEFNTVKNDNFDEIKAHAELAMNQIELQEAAIKNFTGDKKSRSYEKMVSDLNVSKINYSNLKSRLDNIERDVELTITSPIAKANLELSKKIEKEMPGYYSKLGADGKRMEAVSKEDQIRMLEDKIRSMPGGDKIVPKEGINQIGIGEDETHNFLLSKYLELSGEKVNKNSIANRNIFNWLGDKDLAYDSKLIDGVNEARRIYNNKRKEYLENNPYSESYIDLVGLSSGAYKSTIGGLNDILTAGFDGAAYSEAYSGRSINEYINRVYNANDFPNGITKELRVSSGVDHEGNAIETLIIRDKKTGIVIETKPVTRGPQGSSFQMRAAQSLMNSEVAKDRQLGNQMANNITYMPAIKRAGLRAGGISGRFFDDIEVKQGDKVDRHEVTWTKHPTKDEWVIKVGDYKTSDTLFSEAEVANFFADLIKK